MKNLIAVIITIFALSCHLASASIIVTDSSDDSALLAIRGFDAGSLGIVDMDFGGSSFNDAFGTATLPAGYLFTNSRVEAMQILNDISDLLNNYNASASTAITKVVNSVGGTAFYQRFNIAFNVQPSANGHVRSFYNANWAFNASTRKKCRRTQLRKNDRSPSFRTIFTNHISYWLCLCCFKTAQNHSSLDSSYQQ